MRILFLVLVAANVLALVVQFVVSDAETPVVEAPAGGTLRLLSELPARGSSGERCYMLGPIRDERQARRLYEALDEFGLAVMVEKRQGLEPLGYWVYLPPAPSLQAAQAVGMRLTEKGVSDFVYVVGSEKANAISLGLYRDEAKAQERVRELGRLGFTAQLERRYARQMGWVVTAELPPAASPPEIRGGSYHWQTVDCSRG